MPSVLHRNSNCNLVTAFEEWHEFWETLESSYLIKLNVFISFCLKMLRDKESITPSAARSWPWLTWRRAGVWSDPVPICPRGCPGWSPGGSSSGCLPQLGSPESHRPRPLALRGKPGQKGKVCNDLLSISLVNMGKIRKINNDLRNMGNWH